MKNIATTIVAVLVLLASNHLFAQNSTCESGYYPFAEGNFIELTHYDKKGKPSAITQQKILSIEEAGNGFKAVTEMRTSDEKGKNEQTITFDMECRDNAIFIDMRTMMNPQSMESMKDMEMEITGDALAFPNDLTPNQVLPDAIMEMKSKMNGMNFLNMKFSITNRRVEGNESVTTPAGTFDCVKLSYDTEMKSIIKMKFNTSSWYAKGVGMVKTENYDKNGKVESSTVLTKFQK